MNVEIGTEAAQFPEKEYINGIFLAVYIQITYSVTYIRSIAAVEMNNCFYEKPPGFLSVYLEAGWRPVRVNISLPSRMMAFSQGGSFRPAS
jgi:hypothetical protein